MLGYIHAMTSIASTPLSPDPTDEILISVVVPVHDEAGAAVTLARGIAAAFEGQSFGMIFVDHASRDGTLKRLPPAKGELPVLRAVSHGQDAG